jgi:3-oxoacyl-[acyl-carrier-protein] synthase I
MSAPLAVLGTGLVSSVGLSAPASCAAIRAGLTNPTPTRFFDVEGEQIMAHQVPLERPWAGRARLVKMAAMAIAECLAPVAREDWTRIPLMLCVAEQDRPGRLDDLDELLFAEIQQELGVEFSAQSLILPQGRVSAAIALSQARRLVCDAAPLVLVAAADSFITGPAIDHFARQQRLLTERNSNAFMPGEAAGASLLGRAGSGPHLVCTGLGFATEPATIDSDAPLRGEGLATAIRNALSDAGIELHALDFRITDISGEQYYFKEAALALLRTLRGRKEEFDIWHPAECIGEVGCVAGLAMLAAADAACRKGYARGPGILFHTANDAGQRAAAILQYGPTA